MCLWRNRPQNAWDIGKKTFIIDNVVKKKMHGSVLVRREFEKRNAWGIWEEMCIIAVMMKNFMIVIIYQGH